MTQHAAQTSAAATASAQPSCRTTVNLHAVTWAARKLAMRNFQGCSATALQTAMAKAATLQEATLAQKDLGVSSCACRKAVSGPLVFQESAKLAGNVQERSH
jgi:hypothetical protein